MNYDLHNFFHKQKKQVKNLDLKVYNLFQSLFFEIKQIFNLRRSNAVILKVEKRPYKEIFRDLLLTHSFSVHFLFFFFFIPIKE